MKEGGKDGGSAYFRKLFQIGGEDDIKQAINQVFLFVHEMKTLLQVISTQFARTSLSADHSTPLSTLMDMIKHKLQH